MAGADCLIVIPARWGSSRLPGKPLLPLAGQPLIAWVVQAALRVRQARGVRVATDHPGIAEAAQQAGAVPVLTGSSHRNGTERLLEVMEQHPAELYVNLQGDEPLLDPSDVGALIDHLNQSGADVVSLRHAISPDQALERDRVKVVCGSDGRALYFSRSPVPHGASSFWQHIGVYGFRAAALERISRLAPTELEAQESLEQLRWLEGKLSIELLNSSGPSLGVDTASDADRVDRILRLRRIELLLCDVDGVLTDGRIWYGTDGEQLKAFHARDGLAMRLLVQQGIQVALVSGRDSAPLRRRMHDLGITEAVLGEPDKARACQRLSERLQVDPSRMAYVGDDTLDLAGMEICGWSFAVADAPEGVKLAARHVLNTQGGSGAIREVAELLLQARGLEKLLSKGVAFSSTGLLQGGTIQ